MSEEKIMKHIEEIRRIDRSRFTMGELEAIQGLLDLYNREKSLNGELQIRYKIENEKYKDEKQENILLKISLLEMINQFAYDLKTNEEENETLYTGGLNALENAFSILNIDEGIPRKKLWNMIKELGE